MADSKISALTNYTSPQNTDVLPIVDTANTATKKITWANIVTAITTALSSSFGVQRSISSISSPTTAGSTALTDYTYLVSGSTTLTLPTAVGNTNEYTINSVSGTTTVNTTSSQTINGSTSVTILEGSSLTLTSDNSNWRVI